MLSGCGFVQEDAQGVDVRTRVDVRCGAAKLFRGGVGESAHELAGLRRCGIDGLRMAAEDLRQPEVENVGATVEINEDVCGLEIAVNDPALVGEIDGVADVCHQSQQAVALRPVLAQVDVERNALDVLHGEPVPAVRGHAAFEHGHDERVTQARDDFDFSFKAPPLPRGGQRGREHHLDRDEALGPGLASEIDDALSSAMQLADDFEPLNARKSPGFRAGCGDEPCGAGGFDRLEKAVVFFNVAKSGATLGAGQEMRL